MISLRPYQQEAIDAIFAYWAKGGGNLLIDLATGTGKSVIIATLARDLLAAYPSMNILCLVHVRELVEQNAKAILRAWPQAPIGINSAGLGRRDKRAKILFASIQSVAREDASTLGPRHLILIDEAHLVPRAGEGQYRTFLGKMREQVPDLRVAGFTATPYRLDSGRLDEGKEALFDEVVYTYDIAQGVADGFLSPLVSRATSQSIDVSGVARRGGEFVPGALEAAANIDAVTQGACDEMVARGEGRRSWLVFCSGVAHAENVCAALKTRGVAAAAVTADTRDRGEVFAAFQRGQIRALCGVNVFSTGFDAPAVDLIALLRPTLSTSLYVQQLGRGTRLSPATGKTDCLVLDYAGNVRRHGPVDAVNVSGRRGGEGKVAVESVRAKTCPSCETLVPIQCFTCTYCGHEWERPVEPKHEARADREAAVMSRELQDRWLDVADVSVFPHAKDGSPTSMRVEYECGVQVYREWVTFEHPGFPGAKAAKWWRNVVGTREPVSTREALQRFPSEAKILAVTVQRDGKYWRVAKRQVRRADGRIFEIDARLDVRAVALEEVRAA